MTWLWHLNIRVISYSTADAPKHHLVSYGTISVTRTTHEQLKLVTTELVMAKS